MGYDRGKSSNVLSKGFHFCMHGIGSYIIGCIHCCNVSVDSIEMSMNVILTCYYSINSCSNLLQASRERGFEIFSDAAFLALYDTNKFFMRSSSSSTQLNSVIIPEVVEVASDTVLCRVLFGVDGRD